MDFEKRYREFDVAVEDLFKQARDRGHKIPCARGCDACCYDVAVVSHLEMVPMIEAVRALPAEERRKIRARMSEWLARAERAGIDPTNVEPDVPTWFRAKLKCPLLDSKTHDCTIYASRPGLASDFLRDVVEATADAAPEKEEVPLAMGLLPTMLLVGWDAVESGEPDVAAFMLRRFAEPGHARRP